MSIFSRIFGEKTRQNEVEGKITDQENQILRDNSFWETIFNQNDPDINNKNEVDVKPGKINITNFPELPLRVLIQYYGHLGYYFQSFKPQKDVFCQGILKNPCDDYSGFKLYRLIITNESPDSHGLFDCYSCSISFPDKNIGDYPFSSGQLVSTKNNVDSVGGEIILPPKKTIPAGIILTYGSKKPHTETHFHFNLYYPYNVQTKAKGQNIRFKIGVEPGYESSMKKFQ